jgi:hypothetical protein
VAVAADIATVTVTFTANTALTSKTYTVSIASGSSVIKGSTTVDIIQAAADTRATLSAGAAVDAAAADTSAAVTFTGATGLSLTAADFAVSSSGTISNVAVAADIATVTVTFTVNDSPSDKTYTVSIASGSTKIKGDAEVAIIQAATGKASITVGFAYGEITITGDDGSNVISKSGDNGPTSLSLSAVGYTGVIWYVDGNPTGITDSGTGIELKADDYTAQKHTITFTGTANGRRYSSRPIPFAVKN